MVNVQDQPLEQNDEIQQDIDDSESNEHDGDGHEDDQEQEVDDDDSDGQESSSSCSSIPEVPFEEKLAFADVEMRSPIHFLGETDLSRSLFRRQAPH